MNATFNQLREANRLRLPQFKTKQGKLAHSKPDGSDWTPAQWLQAVIGELGEWATERMNFESEAISPEQYGVVCRKELADPAVYLDILAQRALDTTSIAAADPARLLMHVVMQLGQYANWRKKYERGDIDRTELMDVAGVHLREAKRVLEKLIFFCGDPVSQRVIDAHPTGVDLGDAVIEKFNEVSVRVGSTVRMDPDGRVVETEPVL